MLNLLLEVSEPMTGSGANNRARHCLALCIRANRNDRQQGQEEQTLQAGSATHQTRTISVFHTSNLVKLNKS